MPDINRDISIEQIDYSIDINNTEYSIEINPQRTFEIQLNEQGPQGLTGPQGEPGEDGFSPSASVTQSGDVTTITITDKEGTTTESIDMSDYVVTESTVADWGFTKNEGTVTSVNNAQPVNGNVTISIPDTSTLANKDLSNLTGTGEAKFQAPLVSGTNIKTINSTSLLGSGDIAVQPTIDTNNKLNSDLVDDANQTHKFATASQLTQIGTNQSNISSLQTTVAGKQDTISDLSTIRQDASNGNTAYSRTQGYGNIVTHNTSEFATATQGQKADTAVQPGDLATVATSGSYTDLINKPYIPPGVVVDQTYDGTSANSQSGVAIEGELSTNYQSKLVSGTNIKTINSTSLLGSGNVAVQATISDLATIRSGASAGATAVQPSDITDVVRQETTDTITLYAWNSGYGTIYTTTVTAGKADCYDNNARWLGYGEIASDASSITWGNDYFRDSLADTTATRSTLTDNNSNALNIVQADGQWVQSYHSSISTVTSKSSTTVDISSYLPDDSYDYEVMINLYADYISSAGDVGVGTATSPLTTDCFKAYGRVRETSRSVAIFAIFPISSTKRNIYTQREVAVRSCRLDFIGYRRIGTNS